MFDFLRRKPSYEDRVFDIVPDHLEEYLPGESLVWQELESDDDLPIDVMVWPPTPERDLWTLSTVGASAHRMPAPDESLPDRCELIITLPADWPSLEEIQDMEPGESARWSWPVTQLQRIARLPSRRDTWLGAGHTVQAGRDPDETLPGTGFTSIMLGLPISLFGEGEDISAMTLSTRDATVMFYGLVPLYPSELAYKMEHGAGALLELLTGNGVDEGVHPDRPPVV